MLGADAANLQKFVTWATNQRNAQMANGITISAVTASLGADNAPVTLTWTDGVVVNGQTLPADWDITTH